MPETNRPLDVLVVAQTPPPLTGQAIATQVMLDGRYRRLRLHHIRMAFSRDLDEVGRFGWGKIGHLVWLISAIVRRQIRDRTRALYYVPAGSDRIPMYRDFAILLATRWLFPSLILHFHAAGLSGMYSRLTWPERIMFRLAYGRADLAIRLSPYTPEDGRAIGARDERIVLNGLEDALPGVAALRRMPRETPRLAFMGALRESKGVLVLLDACRRLHEQGSALHVRVIGQFVSPAFANEVAGIVEREGLAERVEFTGELKGDAKWRALAECDILVFPSHYEHEACPLVVLEAMCLGMPVVATRWRGITSLVEDGETGFLVPVRDPEALAKRVAALLADPELRARMGRRGRERYEAQFTVEHFWANMEAALLSVQ